MPSNFSNDLDHLLDNANDNMVDYRHDLHQHPELSFGETRTSRVITERLTAMEWHIERCPTPTGAVATLDTGRPGKTVMIRADIDGLPVLEERELSFRSSNDGVMHACGHDVHTAALLGVADVLGQRRDQLCGKFVALFQPAEEGLGGALAMIEGGLLDDHAIDFVVGGHVTSLLPVGLVATRPGVLMSEVDAFTVTLHGVGGHGAMAATQGNVVLASAALVQRLGAVVVDLAYEGTSCACSAGVINAGTAPNVVPRRATVQGTLRTFTDQQRVEALGRLESELDRVRTEFGVTCDFTIDNSAPRVNNDIDVTARVEASAKSVLGESSVLRIPPASPSDDVSEFLNRIPGCYLFVGGALADGTSGMHHAPEFAVDDAATRSMASVLAAAAVDLAQL